MRKNNKGFTLIEMLIVVAIIAILVAVSIPLVNNSLERAREATDAANERAAKAEAIILYLNDDIDAFPKTLHYDASKGTLGALPSEGYGKCDGHKNGIIYVTISSTGDVEVGWETTAGTGGLEGAHNGNVTG